ncbi:hypothetical protein JCM10908_002679 [Rhodotorula pacifica]|uniref:choline transporter-like family protein n=1 Tax=Rhodotorula pacifica TaxID=1495444 RepID=UPI00316FC523
MATSTESDLDPYALEDSLAFHQQQQQPSGGLFYSTRTDWATNASHHPATLPSRDKGKGKARVEAISLVESDHDTTLTTSSDERDEDGAQFDDELDGRRHRQQQRFPTARSQRAGGVQGSSFVAGLPAFVSRLGGGRGWKAYESVAVGGGAASRHVVYSDDERDGEDDEDDEDDEPVPGAFVSQPATATGAKLDLHGGPTTTTLHVYPVPGPGGYDQPHSTAGGQGGEYRDSIWIVLYGVSLLGVVALALQAWWTSPPPSSPSSSPSDSLFSSALPTLSLLSAISALAGIASLSYLLTIQHALAALLRLAIYGGPALFVVTGITAFAGSWMGEGVARDRGWKVGVRWLAVGCFVLALGLFRSAVARRKELNRAISVGQLACQTVLAHPSLIFLAIFLSLLSAIITIPFLSLIATLLSYAPTSPHTASWGTALTLLVYLWTLAIGRGLSHAIVGGCIGTWYFEREDDEYQGPAEVTRASIARATGPSLGTVIAASFFVAIFSTLATLLHSLRRALESSRFPSALKPLTALAPVFAALAGYAAFFNSYALSYAGMTGETFWSASRETAELFRTNRARNIRDTALLRLTLFISSAGWGLLTGLLAFFLTSSHLSPQAGGFAPTLALLCYAIPMYTLRMCHNLIGDAVDALFVCTHLDAENQLSHCPKAVEAFGTPEAEGDVLTLPI